ncbi:MAG: hypothetical protein MJZ68_02870 [archaeon]|nr:hypothetical protein [archaeon]
MTTYFCGECGSVYEEDSDFCYVCGALRSSAIALDDSGNQLSKNRFCPECGAETVDGVCSNCKTSVEPVRQQFIRKRPTRIDYIAMALAIIPGAFDLFGLGHLVLRKWSRAFMYLSISAVFLYFKFFIASVPTVWTYIISILGFVIYMKQAFEIIGRSYGGF